MLSPRRLVSVCLALLAPHLLAAPPDPARVERVAFGSCAHQLKPQPAWDAIAAAKPDLMLLLGDNIYGDSDNLAVLAEKYALLAAKPGFQKLRAVTPVLATWDDHDYGANDAGREFVPREGSRKLMLDFFGEPADSPRRTQPGGLYTAHTYGPPGQRVQIILLDLRWARTPLKAVSSEAYHAEKAPKNLGPYLPNDDASARQMDEEQWAWLEQRLREPAEVRLIGSSIQCIPEFTGWEAWANFPRDRARLLALLRDTRAAGVVLLSGDTHWAELSRLTPADGAPYPLWEITSSGLTEEWPNVSPNRHRVGAPWAQANFGLVSIDWAHPDTPAIQLSILSADGTLRRQQTVFLSDLQPAR